MTRKPRHIHRALCSEEISRDSFLQNRNCGHLETDSGVRNSLEWDCNWTELNPVLEAIHLFYIPPPQPCQGGEYSFSPNHSGFYNSSGDRSRTSRLVTLSSVLNRTLARRRIEDIDLADTFGDFHQK